MSDMTTQYFNTYVVVALCREKQLIVVLREGMNEVNTSAA